MYHVVRASDYGVEGTTLMENKLRSTGKRGGEGESQPNRSTVPIFAEDGEEQQEKPVKTADVRSRYKPGTS